MVLQRAVGETLGAIAAILLYREGSHQYRGISGGTCLLIHALCHVSLSQQQAKYY